MAHRVVSQILIEILTYISRDQGLQKDFESCFSSCHKKLPPLKPILTLQTWGQKCFVSDSEPFEITDFDLGHPVSNELIYMATLMGSRLLNEPTINQNDNI